MKRRRILLLLIVAFGSFIGTCLKVSDVRQGAVRKNRAEAYMLDILTFRVEEEKEAGFDIPTNWTGIIRMEGLAWEEIEKGAHLSSGKSITNMYLMLANPTILSNEPFPTYVFLIRSNALWQPGVGHGRWALIARSNKISRTWIPEEKIQDDVRRLTTPPVNF